MISDPQSPSTNTEQPENSEISFLKPIEEPWLKSKARWLRDTAVKLGGDTLLSPPYGGFGYYHNHGPRNIRKIALTFDDGPSEPATRELLDAMGELNVKGTFFCVGVNAKLNSDLLFKAYSEGHIIGNHSWRHSRKTGLLPNSNGEHIDMAAEQIAAVIGQKPRLYRPPWGWLTPWEGRRLTQRGYKVIGWDVYTLDWQIPEPDGVAVAEKARQDIKPGSIILFHDAFPEAEKWNKKQTTRAVQHLVKTMRAEGYEFVTVPELLNIPAYSNESVVDLV